MKSRANILPLATILLIAIATAVYQLFTVPIGDDLVYLRTLTEDYHGIDGYILWGGRHWLTCNGRMANYVMPLLEFIGPMGRALMIGALVGLFFWLTVRLCGRRLGVTAQMAIIAALAFTFPWWDSFWLVCVHTNYTWTAVAALGFFALYFAPKVDDFRGWCLVGACIVAFVAGIMHEASGAAVAGGIFVYWIIQRRWPRGGQLAMAICLAVGAAMSTLSPGIIGRFLHGSAQQPDDPMWLLVLKSDAWALALLLLIVLAAICCPRRLMAKMRTPWVAVAVASLLSMCVSAVGGIVGRSGWFACTFAIIALVRWYEDDDIRINRKVGAVVSAVLAVIVAVHYVALCVWQMRMGTELKDTLTAYDESKTGIVYYDATPEPSLPWWLLERNCGIVDPDDYYLIETIEKYIGRFEKPYVVLPTAVRDIDAQAITAPVAIGDSYVSADAPECDERRLLEVDGVQYISEPFVLQGRQLYYITPREQDPGDR